MSRPSSRKTRRTGGSPSSPSSTTNRAASRTRARSTIRPRWLGRNDLHEALRAGSVAFAHVRYREDVVGEARVVDDVAQRDLAADLRGLVRDDAAPGRLKGADGPVSAARDRLDDLATGA